MDLHGIPVARELFAQWKRARGDRTAPTVRPFSREWESLLENAGIHAAVEIEEARRDARVLEEGGWLVVQAAKWYPDRIARVAIPLNVEERWMAAFGFVRAENDYADRVRARTWTPQLQFLVDERLFIPIANLEAIDEFVKNRGNQLVAVPIKERSLQIFGDEKRLDELYRGSALFAPGRLKLDQLACFVVPEPLPWARGTDASKPVLVLENVATWDSYRRWNEREVLFSCVVYGGGERFREGVLHLAAIFAELGGPREVFYFGDVDQAGLRIPRLASRCAVEAGLPPIIPHIWSYSHLFAFGVPEEIETCTDEISIDDADCAWLGELASAARLILKSGRRLPQERIGWEFLRQQKGYGH